MQFKSLDFRYNTTHKNPPCAALSFIVLETRAPSSTLPSSLLSFFFLSLDTSIHFCLSGEKDSSPRDVIILFSARAPSPKQDNSTTTLPPKKLTPNPRVCLLTPLNIYTLIQTVSERKKERIKEKKTTLCFTLACRPEPFASISSETREKKRSRDIRSDQSDGPKQRYTRRTADVNIPRLEPDAANIVF